jgi:hypothetical protein
MKYINENQVRNYYYYGFGQQLMGQELSVVTANNALLRTTSKATTQITPENLKEKSLVEATPALKYDPQQLPCLCCNVGVGMSEAGMKSGTLYSSLPPHDFIRLLEIFPSDARVILSCRLHIVRLSQARGHYEGLSYCWGEDQTSSMVISCNEREVKLGRNLYDALHCLRLPSQSRIIWADALCINQQNLMERSEQVQQMKLVFEYASRVLVWLGPGSTATRDCWGVETKNLDPSFSGTYRIVNTWRRNSQRTAEIPQARFWSRIPEFKVFAPGEAIPPDSYVWNDIFDLFKCNFFTRLWIIQEVALAQDALVYCGNSAISWEWVGLASAIIRNNFYRIHRLIQSPGFIDSRARRPGTLETVPIGVLNAYFIYRISQSQLVQSPLPFSFHDLLALTRQFRCKDPRDRVFGILGLPTAGGSSNDIVPFIKTDYTMSAQEVYHQVALKILSSSSSLRLLSSVQTRDQRSGMMMPWRSEPEESIATFDLPSWVPQWQIVLTQTLTPLEPDEGFAAAGFKPMQRRETNDPTKLLLLGIVIQPICIIVHLGFMSFWRGEDGGDRWANKNFGNLETLFQKNKITEAMLELLAMTLTAGKDWYGFPVKDAASHIADYAKCLLKNGLWWSLERLSNPDSVMRTGDTPMTFSKVKELAVNGHADRFLDAVVTACQERQVFMTSSGHPGVGPGATITGDCLCVLYGANVPFILRRQGRRYAFVGECYVYDLMHGEAVNELSRPGTILKEEWIEIQ